jgi:hypothetical protein
LLRARNLKRTVGGAGKPRPFRILVDEGCVIPVLELMLSASGSNNLRRVSAAYRAFNANSLLNGTGNYFEVTGRTVAGTENFLSQKRSHRYLIDADKVFGTHRQFFQ